MIAELQNKIIDLNNKDAILTIDRIIAKSIKAKEKIRSNSPSFSLLTNRIKALQIAKDSIDNKTNHYSEYEINNAITQINSLISKSEKVFMKLDRNMPQAKTTESNLLALYVVSNVLTNK